MYNNKLETIEVTVGNAKRDVYVNVVEPTYSTGYVGRAYFAWRSDQHDLPYVKVGGKVADVRTRQLVKLFLMAYKEMLLSKRKSPLHVNTGETKPAKKAKNVKPGISGVPKWMRDEHKVWKVCKRKDGSAYMRRTHFKPESKEIVEKYLPHCSGCPLRVHCLQACADPDLMSQSDVFQESVQPEDVLLVG